MKLKIEGLSAGYDKDFVIKDLSLSVNQGEFLSLLGPSGCGKTTLMKAVAGILPAQGGRILLDGEDITGLPIHKRGTVIVFQDMRLFPHMTVEENVAFPLKMQGRLNDANGKEKVEHMLHVIGLEGFRDDYPGQLSGGMAQRVALVRTLISQPEILLLDEPLGALDAFTRMNMQDEILSMWREHRQLALMVTHDVDEAIYMGTRVIVMDANPGRIIADIKIEEEFPRDRSSERFIRYRNMILNQLHFAGRNI